MFEICMVLALWGPPPGPHGDHTYDLNNFESSTPKDDSCQVWLKSNHAFSRRRWKCKSLRTTHDGRRTADDGRKRMAIAHLSLRLRWAKNLLFFSPSEKKKIMIICLSENGLLIDRLYISTCHCKVTSWNEKNLFICTTWWNVQTCVIRLLHQFLPL